MFMNISSEDWAIRAAAFRQVKRLRETRISLSASDINGGFIYDGSRLPLVNPRRGIFKPKQMEALLSIKTVYPKPGNTVWYDDQREVHQQIYRGDEAVDYSFMGTNADAADNRWLREAMHRQVPIIYFLGISPGRYQAIVPAFVVDWDAPQAKARIAFSDPSSSNLPRYPEDAGERRYALRLVKQRLHQAAFREAVVAAYGARCAVSGLPEPVLLDAAHIMSDHDEEYGQPVVPNGIPLSKIHHAAFDAHLIGISPDFIIKVSNRLLKQSDGPLLESMKQLNGRDLRLPGRVKDRPDQDRLQMRFKIFLASE